MHKNTDLSQTPNRITFAVSDVKRAKKRLPEAEYGESVNQTLGLRRLGEIEPLEAYSRDTKPLIVLPTPHPGQTIHPFIHGANIAYDEHRPFVMSPDMIWLLITQGFALHLNANAESLRSRFVEHEGKAKITVRRDEFIRGFAGNDWESVFTEFSEQIRTHIGETAHSRIVPSFSTTGIVEKAAFEVTMMDAFQNYFDFNVVSLCGIPEITLEGTPADWAAIRAKAEELDCYDLEWWTVHLLPVLDQFVAASKGIVDQSFWRSFYKIDDSSGGPYINGEILNLFPYLMHAQPSPEAMEREIRYYEEHQHLSREAAISKATLAEYGQIYRNRYLGWKDTGAMGGLVSRLLPPALSVAPFTWAYRNTDLPMEFVAGFVGITQNHETLAVRPEIGWAVREKRDSFNS